MDSNEDEDNILAIFNEDEMKSIEQNLFIQKIDVKKIADRHIDSESAIKEFLSLLPFGDEINNTIYNKINEINQIFKNKKKKFILTWNHICNRLGKHLWTNLMYDMQFIVENKKNNININDLSKETVNKILNILSIKRSITKSQREYIQHLIEDSKSFIPITNANNKSLVK